MLTREEIIFIQQFRSLELKNKFRVVIHKDNPLLVARFRRFFIRHKFDDGSNIATSKSF